MLKVTVDTNVIISALLKSDSVPARVVSYVLDECQLCISRYILDELDDVLKKPKVKRVLGWSKERIQRYLAGLEEASILIVDPPLLKVITQDPYDDNVLACAVAAQANYLVSGDVHLRQLGSYRRIQIVSPSEFLAIIQKSSEKA